MGEEVVEKFRPTSGRISGVLAVLLAASVVVVGLLDRDRGFPAPVVWAALVLGVLAWASMLRPRLWVTGSSLVIRSMLSTVAIPLAAIETVVVRQVLAVRAGDQRWVSSAVGRSWRQTLRTSKEQPSAAASYPVFVEERIRQLADDARAQAGIRNRSEEQQALASGVRRHWAWPEIVALVVTTVGFVVAVLL